MERTEAVTMTNLCMITDGHGNVLVEEKIGYGCRGLIFPGGHVEEHEPIVDSVVREVWEETGLTVSDVRLCGMKDWIQEDGSRYMVFLFRCDRYTGTLKSSAEGKVFWVPLDDLLNRNWLWHLDKMMEIFNKDTVSELFLDKNGDAREPVLK